MKVLVTGATGFVGTTLCRELAAAGCVVRRAVRAAGPTNPTEDTIVVGDLGPETKWSRALEGIDAVVHLVARTHAMHDSAPDSLAEYRRVNVFATAVLARAAAEAGVRRLVFVSSIKVNGEQTTDAPFTEADAPHPEDAYGISKWEAEQALWRVAGTGDLEGVVLRPPLLYGPGVKGNFLALLRAIDRGIPLPLASVKNRRSLLNVDYLADAIIACLRHPAAVGRTYLVADRDSVSTPDLIRNIATALGKPARLVPFPPALLRFGAVLFGQSDAAARLLGSLVVASGTIQRELNWRPRYGMAQGLAATARWYYQQPDSKARI